MSLLFIREGEYSIQALCYIALKPYGELVDNRELTDELGIPYFYLGKILQKLVRRGYLISRKGSNGSAAFLTARAPNPFASVCGRVCAARCEDSCRRGKIDAQDENPAPLL